MLRPTDKLSFLLLPARFKYAQACLQAAVMVPHCPLRDSLLRLFQSSTDQDWVGFSQRFLKGFDHLSLEPWNWGLNYMSYDSCTWQDSGSCKRTGQDWCTTRGMWLKRQRGAIWYTDVLESDLPQLYAMKNSAKCTIVTKILVRSFSG